MHTVLHHRGRLRQQGRGAMQSDTILLDVLDIKTFVAFMEKITGQGERLIAIIVYGVQEKLGDLT